MQSIAMLDVGDGLCMGLSGQDGTGILVDCGSSTPGPSFAFSRCQELWWNSPFDCPEVVFLSHFHSDHYNGLLYGATHRGKVEPRLPSALELVYYPAMPTIKNAPTLGFDFLRCLFAIEARRLGITARPLPMLFLKVLQGLNGGNAFKYAPLVQGDTAECGAAHMEVIWPPREILAETRTAKKVANAVDCVEKACISDAELKGLYDSINTGDPDLPMFTREGDLPLRDFPEAKAGLDPLPVPATVPECVKDADEALRKVTNSLSLCFYEDNRLLFLGDLEDDDIESVVSHLVDKKRTSFASVVAPHHGTHWHDSLNKISAGRVLVSNGPMRMPDFRTELKEIAKNTYCTHVNGRLSGSVQCSLRPPPWSRRGYLWTWDETPI